MGDDLMGLGGGSSKQLSSATATTSIADVFGGRLDLTQLGPLILTGLVIAGVMVVAMFAFRD